MQNKHSRTNKPIPEELIRVKAYEIYKACEQNGEGGNPEADWHEAA